MKKTIFATVVLLAGSAWAGTNTTSVAPPKVRSETLLSMSRWAAHPTDATGCGGADCCVAPATDPDCESFKARVDAAPQGIAAKVEEWYTRSTSVNWTCNQWVPEGRREASTYCEAWPATQSVRDADVAIALSGLAAAAVP